MQAIFQLNNLIGRAAQTEPRLSAKMLQFQSLVNGITVSIKTRNAYRLEESLARADEMVRSLEQSGLLQDESIHRSGDRRGL